MYREIEMPGNNPELETTPEQPARAADSAPPPPEGGEIIGWVPGMVDSEIDSAPDYNGVTQKIRVHVQGMVPVYRKP